MRAIEHHHAHSVAANQADEEVVKDINQEHIAMIATSVNDLTKDHRQQISHHKASLDQMHQ